MSIKTLRKRIALVAVSALGAGLMSVTPAFAADGAIDGVAATGLCATQNAAGTYQAIGDDSVYVYITLGGSVTFSNDGDADYTLSAASGGVVTGSGGSSSGALSYAVSDDADTATFTPNATGTVKLSLTADAAPTVVADYLYAITVASCSSSTWSETRSSYETSATEDATPDGEAGSTYTFADESTVAISLLGKNAYNATLPLGVWTATSSNTNLLVDIDTTAGSAAIGTLSTSTDSIQTTGDEVYVAVEQAETGTAQSGTISVTYNGAVVYSKVIKITGDAAKITVSGVDVQDTANTAAGDYDVTVQDAAGNYLAWTVSGDTTKYNNVVTSVTGGTTTAGDPSGTVAAATWTCNGASGEATVRVKATTNAGTTIYSNDFVAKCGTAAYTYTAALDKAVYAPGDLATLTITAKDAYGFAPFKGETVDAAAGTPSIAGSQMTAVNTPAAADVFDASGVKKYTFTVGATDGKYNMAVNLGYAGNAAVAVPYEVKSTSTAVTNAEVLAAIVKLIASINKQIKALQKSLRR